MKEYIVTRTKDEKTVIGKFADKAEAVDVMNDYIDEFNNENDLDSSDDDFLTPFDFTLEIVETKEVNELITNFEEARKILGGKPNADFTVSKKILSGNTVNLQDVTRLVNDTNPQHVKALISLNELFTIAEAWNKKDGFVPDYSNSNQYKYFPWFVYDKDAAGFVAGLASAASSYANATLGSRLCFKTANRARQFGKQFIDLWNDVLLFR
ncbi:hypothetical protein [Bacteroides pyogenes]|uniref:hypothetical protein n=1 Tax=Bacteroides pyogenes TaxID=310300 RepID=UPI002FD8E120